MTTTRETVLAALFDQIRLDAGLAGVTVARNQAVPVDVDDLPAGGLVVIQDGEANLEARILGVSVFEWRHQVEIACFAPGADAAAAGLLVDKVVTAITADPGLGGTVGDLEVAGVAYVDSDESGIEVMPGLLLSLILTYDTAGLAG